LVQKIGPVNSTESVAANYLDQLAKRFELSNLTNENLGKAVKSAVEQLQNVAGEWKDQDDNARNAAWEIRFQKPNPAGRTESDKAVAKAREDEEPRAKVYRAKARETVGRANDLRQQILKRLGTSRKSKQDDTADALFQKLVGGNYTFGDLYSAAIYLDDLGKRFSEM
jgi:2-oxoglutarate dehydrogenase complex dehydrogenase (E1) component-like enzyme